MQCILLAGGIIAIGTIAYSYIGGFTALNDGIAGLASIDKKITPQGFSHYIAIPGVIQFVKSGTQAVGGAWTGIMILTYMFALMGIQSAPAFTMWSFSNLTRNIALGSKSITLPLNSSKSCFDKFIFS